VLPIADVNDLHKAILACSRAPEHTVFGFLTHCVRRAEALDVPVDSLVAMCADPKGREGKLLNKIKHDKYHPKGKHGEFLYIGSPVRASIEGSLREGRLAEFQDTTARIIVFQEDVPAQSFWAPSVEIERTDYEAPVVSAVEARTENELDRTWGVPANISEDALAYARDVIATYLQKLPDTPHIWDDASNLADPRDGGPILELVKATNTFKKIGEVVNLLVDTILAQEGYSSDLVVQQALRDRITEDYLRHFTVVTETLKTYNAQDFDLRTATETTATGFDPLIAAWKLADAGSPDVPFLERFSSSLDTFYVHVPTNKQEALATAEKELDERAHTWGVSSAQRVYALRKSQVLRQVLRRLGVEFGAPTDVDAPYVRLRPYGESPWIAKRYKEVPMPESPEVGDIVFTWVRGQVKGQTDANAQLTEVEVTKVERAQRGIEISWKLKNTTPDGTVTRDGVRPSEVFLTAPAPPNIHQRVDVALEILPTEHIRTVWKHVPYVQMTFGRARGSRSEVTFNLPSTPNTSSIVHLEHHALEFAQPWVMAVEWALLVSLIYEGSVGGRYLRQGTANLPNKYKMDRLSYLHRYPGYWGNEWAVVADFPEAYVGKTYYGDWSDTYAGGICACGNYELLAMFGETLLAARPPSTSLFIGVEERAHYASREAVWVTLLDWYIGVVLYMVNSVGTTRVVKNEPSNFVQKQLVDDAEYGTPHEHSVKLPRTLSELRAVADEGRLRTEIFQKEDSWTLRFSASVFSDIPAITATFTTNGAKDATFVTGFLDTTNGEQVLLSLDDVEKNVVRAGKRQLYHWVALRNSAVINKYGVGAEVQPLASYPVPASTLFQLDIEDLPEVPA
jgi:hypothetical protein